MRWRSHSRLASGLPMDWHERATIGAGRGRRLGAGAWFAAGLVIGAIVALLSVATF